MLIAERFSRRTATSDAAWIGISQTEPKALGRNVFDFLNDSVSFDITSLVEPALDQTVEPPDEYHLPFPKTIFEYDTGAIDRQGLRLPVYQAADGWQRETHASRIGVVLWETDKSIRGYIVGDLDPNYISGNDREGVELLGSVQRSTVGDILGPDPSPEVADLYRDDSGEIDRSRGAWALAPKGQMLLSAENEHYGWEVAAAFLKFWIRPMKHALALLSCRNVSIEPVLPSRQVRRALERHGRHPTRSYRIIVSVPGKRSHTIAGPRRPGEELMPAHMVRGHFAEYTESAPRFGRASDGVGRFWIPAHVRGKRENGQEAESKDYVLVPSDVAA